MEGLMMDYQLNVPAILRRADELFGDREIVSRLPDKSWHRYRYADFTSRAKRLAVALRGLGLADGDRVGTLMWNHHEHLETYIGAPIGGFVTHTLNLRLHPDDNTYIASHAGDRVLVVDKVLWPLAAQFVDRVGFEHVIAVGAGDTPDGAIDYEDLVASADENGFSYQDIDERAAAAMCFTSGTTGKPKGVVYSHRAIAVHALIAGSLLGVTEGDTVLPVVPMFHANAWCFPFTCTLVGANQVFPGPHLDPQSLLDAFVEEQVTISAGVPTIWMGILQALDANPGGWDLSSMRTMTVGGSAPPRAMIEAFAERHGLHITHGWGMTEMCPIGTLSGAPGQEQGLSGAAAYDKRAQQGPPIPFVEIRARGEEGLVAWDGKSMGELEVRGPSIASSYYEAPEAADRWTDDGWFRTGDIVTIGPDGYVEIQDRAKDLVKSGGEWISTVALENALMGHPAVAEAAVIAVPDEKWSERPLAVVVLREGAEATDEELREYLAPSFAKFWLPDRFEFIDEIPKTAVGKFRKTALRERFSTAAAVENH
jgi:acyl-CoA synthetase (AMP-forming)/AMP-acid ligase II